MRGQLRGTESGLQVIRAILLRLEWRLCGQTGLVQLRLLLTQHSFALAAGDVPRCSAIFNAVIQMHSVKKRNHSIAAVVTAG